MADALVSFGLQKLWELLNQEYEQFQGVDSQVTELKRDLNLLSSFLKDADAKKHKSAVVRNCVEEIKEIIYDAEDIIETFLLKDELGKRGSFIKHVRRFSFTIVDHKELASDIRGISKRIFKVIKDMQSFGVQQMIADRGGGYTQPLHDRQSHMRHTFSQEYERNLVGLEANIKKLVGLMVEENNVQVVSITGMGGLGKTTLARQVFNHNLVRNKFDGFTWVCVSQEFTRKSVWQTILRNLRPKNVEENKILEMTESTLQGELFQLLETSKSLIVLDDIWKEEDWNLIKPIFPAEKGWKVLLTSRNESVTIRGDTTYVNFKPECLTIQDSWALFQRIAFPRKDAPEFEVDEGMEEMGKKMIKHCGGLPLAVKVLGGLLVVKYTLHDWKRFYENIRSHIVGRTKFNDSNNSLVYNVLSMSFEELPSYLKHCFLYLAHFPEDHKINIEKLSYYWAAEGIYELRDYNGETIRDVGDRYIEELVRRNMVISERDVMTLRLETCHLHDMMREICLFKAKEENFLQISGIGSLIGDSQSPFRSRRFVSPYPTSLDVERYRNNPKLQSLVFVRCNLWKESWKLSGSSFKRLELLRVLDLYAAKFRGGKLPSCIGSLIHLRYLSLKDAEVSQLPASLGNLKLLIYLNLNVSTWKSVFVPNVVMWMQELRYLALPMRMYEKTKLELSNLVNLETLKNFSTMNSSLKDLCGMVRLRILSINLSEEANIETLSASINGLRHLEDLDIHDHIFDRKIEEGIVLDFIYLKHLKLDIHMPRVLDEQHFPSHLTTISLSGCRLDEDPMSVLEKLLQLKEVSLRYKSFCGKKMFCSNGGFPQLKKLHLYALMEWEEWIVEEGSMPLLHTLRIRNCRELKQLPDGLRFITSLKELEMNSAHLEFKEKLSRGGEEFYKVQHIPIVRIQLVRRPIPSEANISSVGL